MGNKYKFRLSDMISSGSWLYNKLSLKQPKHSKSPSPRILAKPSTVTAEAVSNPRKSYHFGRDLNSDKTNSPRKTVGSKKVPVDAKSRGRVSSCSLSSSASSASNTTSCSTPPRRRSRRPSPEFRFDRVLTPDLVDKTNSFSSSSSSSASRSLSDADPVTGDVAVGAVNLTPIMTKKKNKMVRDAVTERKLGTSKRFSSSLSTTTNSPGVRLRTHSPRLLAAAKRIQSRKGAAVRPRRSDYEAKSKCGGFAVVKSSFDPWKDFRESMVEMIMENGIKESEDLEELLVCYLSLNTEEYHEVIVAVFKQIWCDLTDITIAGTKDAVTNLCY